MYRPSFVVAVSIICCCCCIKINLQNNNPYRPPTRPGGGTPAPGGSANPDEADGTWGPNGFTPSGGNLHSGNAGSGAGGAGGITMGPDGNLLGPDGRLHFLQWDQMGKIFLVPVPNFHQSYFGHQFTKTLQKLFQKSSKFSHRQTPPRRRISEARP